MTKIEPYIIANAKLLLGRLKPPDDIEEHEALSALITMGELIAGGTHVVVPKEPTEAMIEAWSLAKPQNWADAHISDDDANRAWSTADWQAMIAAAPKQPSEAAPNSEWDTLSPEQQAVIKQNFLADMYGGTDD